MADVYPESTDEKPDSGGGKTEEDTVHDTPDQSADSPNRGYLVNPQNPFASRPALKTDIVSSSSASHPHQPAAVHIAPSKLGSNPFVTRAGTDIEGSHKSSVLAPSKLDMFNKAETTSSPSKIFLRPSVLSAQVQSLKQKESEQKEKENQETVEEHSSSESSDKTKSNIDNKVTHENYFATALSSSSSENYFAAALGKSSDKLPDSTTETDENKEFVFGENLNNRVTGINSKEDKKNSGGFVFGQNLAERVVKSDAGNDSADEKDPDSSEETELDKSGDKIQTLEESAREFQAKHDKKPELKEVEATGKLFVFETQNKNWLERGRGLLRLNDSRSSNSIQFESRLVMRTQGSLRLILNTKIWPGMTIERASQKSTSPKDSDNIVRAVDWRIQQLRLHEEHQDDNKRADKRKADSPTDDSTIKKNRTSDEQSVPCIRREESDSSVVDPETDEEFGVRDK
ncbi:hypothetical protein KUTeg_017134 [Tegillarca granosa]|uniref:RanBD1 domain-containing protein n=1 Tax=Tegillarca granosa TaxID=220873 RepID=A0ABQ9EMT9_TEGGR|nr:hypothetical protein KUTeg_017134 [Tegillarca granosa]